MVYDHFEVSKPFPINSKGDTIPSFTIYFRDHPPIWTIETSFSALESGTPMLIDKYGRIFCLFDPIKQVTSEF